MILAMTPGHPNTTIQRYATSVESCASRWRTGRLRHECRSDETRKRECGSREALDLHRHERAGGNRGANKTGRHAARQTSPTGR